MIRDRKRHERGNTLVEFALSFAFLFPVLYGTFQFGYAFFIYNQLNSAVRSGARYGSCLRYESATTTPPEAFQAAVKNVVVYGSPVALANVTIPSLTAANVSVEVNFVDAVPATITVAISGYTLNVIFRKFVISKPSVTFPYTGVYAPS